MRPGARPSSHHASRRSIGRTGGGQRVQGTPPGSTSTRGTRLSSRRRECIHKDHQASCGLPWTDGTHDPGQLLMQVSRGGVNSYTYIWRRGGALQIWLDGTVLLVEKRHVWHKVLDNVHVGERVYARLLGCVGGNTACKNC